MRKGVLSLLLGLAAFVASAEPLTLRMMAGPAQGIPTKEATSPRDSARRAVFDEFQRQNPDIQVVNAGGLELVGQQGESMFLMSMAGDNAPDVFYVNFRQYYNYIDQGFCRPLDDLIAANPDVLDRSSPIILDVLKSYDGKIYSIPWFHVALGLFYRKDHFSEAGLDPNRPPRTWDEFLDYSRKLTESKPGRFGFALSNPPGYLFSNFVYQAGGEIIRPVGQGNFESALNSPAGVKAIDYFRRLVVEKWPDANGKQVGPCTTISTDFNGDIRQGKVSMWFSYTNDVALATSNDLPVSLVGVGAMPAGPGGSSNEINAGMWAINASVKDPVKLAACWKFIRFFAGDDAARINTQKFVEMGMANLVNPLYLEKFGYADYIGQVDPGYVKANREVFKNGHPEPYGRNCQQVYQALDDALDRARLDPNLPAEQILAVTAREMNQKMLGYKAPGVIEKQRTWAVGILTGFLVGLGLLIGWLVRRAILRREAEGPVAGPSGSVRRRVYGFMAVCLAPAVLSLGVWSYYPLGRGLAIAFQDYRITKPPRWVGLDNFIQVFTSPLFYKSLGNSFVYVGLTILIGFILPILLAICLNEIPRFKVLFRTLFYLPAMTSPIVISLLWRQFYDKTDQGLLNQIIQPGLAVVNWTRDLFGGTPWPKAYDWLGDPKLAMLAVVLPGIWAAAGPGSILYLAALKNIPSERYEAADLDGANWLQKIRWIMLPGLKPLILINLLGVFIAGFKASENILVMTFGGPLDATNTIGLEVWKNAFMFLKFGYATAAAWVMGAILIGFTVLQIKNLLRMKFSTAKL